MLETKTCPGCGTANDISRALCEVCSTPLTAYSSELPAEDLERKVSLKKEAMKLTRHPSAVLVMVGFQSFIALLLLSKVFASIASRQQVNAEGTNYIGAALGSIGPVFTAIFLVPAALAVLFLAFQTWSQSSWAWMAGTVFAVACCLLGVWLFGGFAILCVPAIIALLIFWNQPACKKWYGR